MHNWTYRIGLGKQVSPIIAYLNPFRLIVQLMPPDIEARAYILKVILEVGCAALLMRLYLQKIGISGISSLIFPLLYGFNGYLLLWGQHVSFGVIFSLIPLTLYALEVFLQDHKMWPLVLSLSLFMSISIYFFTMAFVFLVIFMTFKTVITSKDIKAFRSNYLKIGFCYVLAGLLAARVILPEILYYLGSPRVGTPLKLGVFETFGWMHYISLLRIFSNNIFGTGVHYYGPLNYYEAPQIYCGLLTLLLVPQFFCYAKAREKIIYGMVFGCLSLALFSPYVAHIFNATFTLNNRYTFVLIFFWIYMAAYALYYIDKSNSFNKPVFFISWSVLFLMIAGILAGGILLQFEFLKLPKEIAMDSLKLAQIRSPNTTGVDFFIFFKNEFIPTILSNSIKILLLLSAYGIVFAIYSKKINKSYWLLFFFVIIELIVLNHPTINERITLREGYLNGNKGYYDGSRVASDYIKSVDTTFYRIHKAYNSVFLNDAAFQGYYGTKGYTSLTEPS
ncbi:MAG: YfhO family protein, partial [Thermodesulfobacteriota bacterium]|nr:YfhO family protein [Thermodesulfobacteriota bacterium]